ncbi:MAG: GerMN domain-containing protein [Treponema sp.]|jgi:hypothetical protein|nr:GerMN domain-containing protein [Treponema sp.]
MGLSKKNVPYKTIYKAPLTKEVKVKILKIVLFWIVFAVFVTFLFIINWPKIRTTMQNALWPAWFKSRTPQTQILISPLPDPLQTESFYTDQDFDNSLSALDAARTSETDPPGTAALQYPESQPLSPSPSQQEAAVNPLSRNLPESPTAFTAVPEPLMVSPDDFSQQEAAALQTISQPVPPSTPRDRSLYFIQIDRNGAILRSKVPRTIGSSNTPLLDVLQSLLQGPTKDEQGQGLMSLIPEGTQIISARVLKDTAYIDISEDFQYNIYGVEGYAGQLSQLIWTATEFANVKDVQILIEGRRVDYLGEGIWIGSPISRESF